MQERFGGGLPPDVPLRQLDEDLVVYTQTLSSGIAAGRLEQVRVIEAPGVTHVKYRVIR